MRREVGTLLLIVAAVLIALFGSLWAREMFRPRQRIDAEMDTIRVRRIEVINPKGEVRLIIGTAKTGEGAVTYCGPPTPRRSPEDGR